MLRITFAVLAIVVGGALSGIVVPGLVPELDGRIVGGEDASIEDFPYQVSVRLGNSHMCGGCIIRPDVILTAAHCIMIEYVDHYSIQYGTTKLDATTNVIKAKRLVPNKDYNGNTIDNDVALIILASHIRKSAVSRYIKMADTSPDAGTPAVVSGWGAVKEGGGTPSVLQKVEVNIIAQKVCQDQYAGLNTITPNMVCAGVPNGGKDACQGDSGGPLVANNTLVGIVSWGMGCARPDYAGVYSNVANLRKWIDANLKQ